MSINMDGGGTEYADHEVQIVGSRAVAEAGNVGEGVESEVIQQAPVSQRGIDSDELAELVAMYRSVSLYASAEADNQQEFVATANGEFNIGINLSGEEELPTEATTENPTTEFVETTDTNSGGNVSTFNFNDPGVLDFGTMAVKPGLIPGIDTVVADTPSGASSGTKSAELNRFIDFRETFGSGPYLDRTDDISLQVEVGNEENAGRAQLELITIMYWDVHEMPEGRASYARP